MSETFTCTSKNGSPPPQFEWYLTDGSNVIDVTENATSTDGETKLHYVPRREHNQFNVVCNVVQEGSPGEREISEILTVKCE